MILLKATTETLQLVTSTTAAIDYSISYVDITTTTNVASSNEGKITSATTTTALSAPASSTQRQVKLITIANRDASNSNSVVLQKKISSTAYNMTPTTTLLAGEVIQFMDGGGWLYYSATGTIKGSQTAGGSNAQVELNSAGTLATDSNLSWNTATNVLNISGSTPQLIFGNVATAPAATATSTLGVYAQAFSGRPLLSKVSPSGDHESLQIAQWRHHVIMWTPGAANGTFTGAAGTATTGVAVSPTTTTMYTAMRRSTFSSVVTTANQQVGIRTDAMFLRGSVANQGGFFFSCRFGLENFTAGDRLFVGLTAGTTAVVTVQPSAVANTIGFCIESGDTAISFLHVDPTVANAIKEVIPSQPALTSGNAYDAYIYCKPNDSVVYFRLDNALTGATLIDSSVSNVLPLATTLLTAQCISSNGPSNTTVGAASIGINRLYVEVPAIMPAMLTTSTPVIQPIALDAVASTGPQGSGQGLSWSHTVGTGATILIVAISYGSFTAAGSVTTAVTYNSISMTSLGKQQSANAAEGFVELFYLLNPPIGTYTVGTNLTGAAGLTLIGGSASYTNVGSIGSPVFNYGSAATSFTASVPSANGNMVVLAAVTGTGFTSITSPAVADVAINGNNNTGAGNFLLAHNASTSSTNTITASFTSDDYGYIGLDMSSAGIPPSVRSSSSNYANATTVNVTVPSGAAIGDIMIALASVDASSSGPISAPDGTWTQLDSQSQTSPDGQTSAVFWKRLTAADTGNYTFGNSSGAWLDVAIICFMNASTTASPTISTANVNTAANASPVSVTANGLTAAAGDALMFAGAADANGQYSSVWGTPSGFTDGPYEPAAGTSWSMIYTATKTNVSAGATGNVAATLSDGGGGWASGYVAWLIRIPV